MADSPDNEGDSYAGLNATAQSTNPLRHSNICAISHADIDDLLLDISDTGFEDEITSLATERGKPHELDAVRNGLLPANETGSNSPKQQVRLNPFNCFDATVHVTHDRDAATPQQLKTNPPVRPQASVGAAASLATSSILASPRTSDLDQYDQLNFGDPTFVNTYSSGSSAWLASPTKQSPPPHLIKGDLYRAHLLSEKFRSALSPTPVTLDPILPSTSRASEVNPSVGLAGSDIPPGLARKGGVSKPYYTSSHTGEQREGPSHQSTTHLAPVSAVSLAADRADQRWDAGRVIDKRSLDYQHSSNNLIIRDYSLTSAYPRGESRKEVSSSRLEEKSSRSNPLYNASGDRIRIEGARMDDYPTHVRMNDGAATRGDPSGINVGVGRLTASLRDDLPSLGFAASNCHTPNHQGKHLAHAMRRGADDQSSHWEEADEEHNSEGAPLLQHVDNTQLVPLVNNGRPRSGLQAAETESTAFFASTSRAIKSPDLACSLLAESNPDNSYSMKRIASEYDSLVGTAPRAGGGSYMGSDAGESPALDKRTVWQRNSYGEFSPLPLFAENGGAGLCDDRTEHQSSRHCHKRRMAYLTDKLALRQLITVVVLCLVFMVGEAIGGALSNSLALFTDVLHLGSDLISFIISLLALWLSRKPATKKMSFGYHRAEVIGALFSVFIIWLVSGVLCYIAVERIIHEHYKEVKADEMLITASLGVVFNIIMGLVLHSEMCCKGAHQHSHFGHGHSHGAHGHGHSHNKDSLLDVARGTEPARETQSPRRREGFGYHPLEQGTAVSEPGDQQMVDVLAATNEDEENLHKHKNINVRAAFIHVLGDIIQSLGVLVAALIIKFTSDEKFRLADPICTFLFSLLVLVTTITVLRDTLLVIMEGVPRDLSYDALKKDLTAIDGVVTVHSLHVWALTLDRNALSVHIAIENPHIHNQVLSAANTLIQDRHQFFHSTVQVELYDEAVMTKCRECLELN